MPKPLPQTYLAYFETYVNQVPEDDLYTAFENQLPIIQSFLAAVPAQKQTFAYAPGKWTLKEMLLHIIDTERIFSYRALCIARGEKNSLLGFDEDAYASHSNANDRSWDSLVEEFLAVRQSTILLFKSFSNEAMQKSGLANNNPLTVISAGFIILGHFYHHKGVAVERYL
jgi:DinB superfamily